MAFKEILEEKSVSCIDLVPTSIFRENDGGEDVMDDALKRRKGVGIEDGEVGLVIEWFPSHDGVDPSIVYFCRVFNKTTQRRKIQGSSQQGAVDSKLNPLDFCPQFITLNAKVGEKFSYKSRVVYSGNGHEMYPLLVLKEREKGRKNRCKIFKINIAGRDDLPTIGAGLVGHFAFLATGGTFGLLPSGCH